ncbi:hypothetical protein [Staphylococcus equorum]|uniref:hypothetical protein n=1 Tax=Staphylococcus equorum TaxID=246432 RepID=UPI00186669D8|nr:hypothetical protein [Staphylococcus equorum]
MLDVDFHIKDIEDIIRYFSTVSPEEKYLKSERRSSLGKLALKLDIVCKQGSSENIEDIKKVIEKVAEANRVISLSDVKK